MITYIASALLAITSLVDAHLPDKDGNHAYRMHADTEADNFDYENKGSDWHTIVLKKPDGTLKDSPEYPGCGTGTEQSPIDIITKDAELQSDAELIGYNYYDFPLNAWNYRDNDPSLKMDFLDEDKRKKVEFKIVYNEKIENEYQMFIPDWFMFHVPSEHYVDGKQFDAEVQFYHALSHETIHDEQRPYNAAAPTTGAMISVLFNREKVENGGGNEESEFV